MAINNPYAPIEHKVYNRTFLHVASASVEYADTSFLPYSQALTKYFDDNFRAAFNPAGAEPQSVKVSSKEGRLSFTFLHTGASLLVGAENYMSFASSMQPRIGALVAFLDTVSIDRVKNLSLRKENVWDLKSDDVMTAYKSAIKYTFRNQEIREVAGLSVPDGPKPVRLSREGTVSLGDGRLTVGFDAEILDDSHIRLILTLEARAFDVVTSEILQTSSVLNDIIYSAFNDMVSDDIIKLMEKPI